MSHSQLATILPTRSFARQVHDVQLDYYGRRVATASSDRLIKVFNVVGEQLQHAAGVCLRLLRSAAWQELEPLLCADLVGHQAPVFEVCWGHPKFGSILASCSFDSRVIIWTETHESVWQQVGGGLLSLHQCSSRYVIIQLLARHSAPICTHLRSTASPLRRTSWDWCWRPRHPMAASP